MTKSREKTAGGAISTGGEHQTFFGCSCVAGPEGAAVPGFVSTGGVLIGVGTSLAGAVGAIFGWFVML
jgi:hypothetical protein